MGELQLNENEGISCTDNIGFGGLSENWLEPQSPRVGSAADNEMAWGECEFLKHAPPWRKAAVSEVLV